jgi:hypothetical protein
MFIVDKLKERSKAKDDGVVKPSQKKGGVASRSPAPSRWLKVQQYRPSPVSDLHEPQNIEQGIAKVEGRCLRN